jgi:hypothetical protein
VLIPILLRYDGAFLHECCFCYLVEVLVIHTSECKPCTKQALLNLSDRSSIPSLAPSLLFSEAASRNCEPSVWILWIHSDILSSFPCPDLKSCLAWKSSVLFSTYEFLKKFLLFQPVFKIPIQL